MVIRIMTSMRGAILLLAAFAFASSASAQDFRIEEAKSVTALDLDGLKPKTIAFTDYKTDQLADPGSGLIKFEDWARERPVQKQFLSLYPSYVEPMATKTTPDGTQRLTKEKLHMYVAEARFVLAKAPDKVDLARYATLAVLQGMDAAITHKQIAANDVMFLQPNVETANGLNPDRPWCEAKPNVTCVQSSYKFEGQLPIGVRLINKLRDGVKKVQEHLEFQSEIRLLSPQEIDQEGLAKLTGVNSPVIGVLEQNIFYVNQVMRFGKFLAITQQHPTDPSKTVATAFMALAVKTDVLETKKEYENFPVLRNLVPAQVLAGKSSFNTGKSLSAGLPEYTRNRIKAIAGLLERG
jgi:hypothetical protein